MASMYRESTDLKLSHLPDNRPNPRPRPVAISFRRVFYVNV